MPFIENELTTPINYLQPIRQFIRRTVNNENEDVDFVPKANMRIWYNNQVEGYSVHKHDALEIVMPVENDYKYIVDGRKFILNANDILFIPPNTSHEIECDSEGSRFIYLFEISFLSNFYDFKELTEFLKEPRLVNINSFPSVYSQVFDHIMQINDTYFMYPSKVMEMTIYSHLLAVFGLLTRKDQVNPIDSMDSKQKDNYYKFKSLISYINSHYMDDLSLEYAATFVGFTKFYFARLFKEYTDTSFYNYLSLRRISASKTLLSDNELSITEIAFQTGFNNLSSFCRCFQRYEKCSPSAYRSMLKRKSN